MRAYLIPIGITETHGVVAFLQRKDPFLTGYCDKVLAVGGEVEAGESPEDAVRRELEEEEPGWWDFVAAPLELSHLHQDDLIVVFEVVIHANPALCRAYVHCNAEGVPALLNEAAVRALPESHWVFPAMRAPLLRRLIALRG